MKKVFGIIVDILTFTVFLVLVLIIFSRVKMMISGKEYFDVFGYSVFNVATGSMEPAISQNDIIIVKEEKSYELNDIVTFKSDNAYVTHRVISKSGNSIVTKGDANNAKDVSIKQEDVIGKVVKVIKQGGVWQQIFTSPMIIIMIFVTLMLFDFAFSYKGNKEEKDKKILVNEEVKVPEVVEQIEDKKTKKKKINIKEKIDDSVKKTKVKIEEAKKKKEEIKKKKEENKKLKEEEKKNKNSKPEEVKISDKDVVDLYKEGKITTEAKNVSDDEEDDDDPFGYTVRLDLSELQKRINEKMNEDEDEEDE